MSIALRLAAADDAATLADLNAVVQQHHLDARPDHFRSTDFAEITEWFREVLSTVTTYAWIAEADDVPVGYVLTFLRNVPQRPFSLARRYIEVDQIAVKSEWRRKGVGRQLVQAASSHAASHGITTVETATWAFNVAAEALFTELGFVPKTIRWERHSR